MIIENLHYINMFLGTGAIILQILSLCALLLLVFRVKNKFLDLIKKHFAVLGFLISLVATLSSLFYSNVIGFIPCFLCWWQRIFIYPLIFLFGAAWLKRDRGVVKYTLPLILVGTMISLYHNFIYYFGEGTAPCDASGVSCVQQLVHEFGGYISIPSLALSTFFSFLALLLVAHFYKKD
jgi:disulfide bond formation protein DsbB